ncbi:ribonuclease H-like protein [Phlegmacium glaucopus]|nr:ribonuclease H-like protein [Phlegmacium glaucopus]
MYNNYIEKHQHDFNQHTAMLTAEICAIDHSHKVTKYIARVDGEQVFTALLTVTNEKGEIQTCNIVATKAQSQAELALVRMVESVTLYGHLPPLVFYTNNMSDKPFLERCVPSLRNNVVPIDKYGDLQAFEIPPSPKVEILPKDTALSINDAVRLILDDVPQDDGCLVIGFDSEWNVEVSSHGTVQSQGTTAVIQIAYKNRVYVFQISEMLSKGDLPHKLKLLLSHPHILKAGRLVNSDLTYLQNACHSSSAFVGGLDLAKFAKDRCVITNISKTSLSNLCALVLHKCLNKNVPECISQAWENKTLIHEQLQYAAKDAYVSLHIYEELAKVDIPYPLPASLQPFTPVHLYINDNTTIIAEAQISPHMYNHAYDGINVTATQTIVEISKVLVPGAIITTH